MYCKNCGQQLADGATFCPHCGTQQNAQNAQDLQNTQYPQYPQNTQNDSGSAGYGVLGFCFPLVGLILYLVWKDTKPKSSKIAGQGALISVIISVVFYVLAAIAGVGIGFM